MNNVVLLIPPFSGEGIYDKDNNQRRPFDFVSVNIIISVLSDKYKVLLFDFDLDGVTTMQAYSSSIQNASALIIYITEGHPQMLIDKFVSSASCPVLVIGPGSKKYKNTSCSILIGEPEFEIVSIIDNLIQHNGINEHKIRFIDHFGDIDTLPVANHSNLAKLQTREGYPSVLISRGCINSCIFCHSNEFYVPGKRVCRKRSISKILNEIRQLKNSGASIVHLECESIANNVIDEYTYNLLKAIEAEKIAFSTFCNITPLANKNFVQIMYSSGCRFVFIGVESSDNYTLQKLKKTHNKNQIEAAIKNLCEIGIQFGIGYLPFNPFTTIDTLTKDMIFLYYLVSHKNSHPLNICCFANMCTMPQKYSFELQVSNLYMKFKNIFNQVVKPKSTKWENQEHIYPERYTRKKILFDSTALMKKIITLCEEKQKMKNIKIIAVNKGDAEFLQELMNNESIMTVLNEVPTTVEVWSDAIIEWEQDIDEEDFIIFYESTPIGWMGVNGLSTVEKKAYIKVIALLPNYQNSGIGQHVIMEIIENLKLRGYISLGLYTDQSNVRAQQCYLKCGFDFIDEIEQKMSNGAVIKRYKMERFL